MASPMFQNKAQTPDSQAAGDAAVSSSNPPQKTKGSFLARAQEDIRPAYSDIPILVCCGVSGLCDSVAFNATGTFTSMQTGNTVFLALGASGLPANNPHLWLRALVSIACFWAGCLAFSRAFSSTSASSPFPFRPKHKLTLTMSFAAQAVCILVSAALAQSQVVPSFGLSNLPKALTVDAVAARDALENNARSLAPLALLAFQFGGQIVASRALGFNEVPTTVLTSLYCDMLSDPLLMANLSSNPKRNRRVVGMVLFLGGAVAGGWIQRSSAGMAAVLWIAGAIKAAMALAWLLWRSKETAAKEGLV